MFFVVTGFIRLSVLNPLKCVSMNRQECRGQECRVRPVNNLIKIDKKSYKNIDIYYIGYIKLKYFDCNDIHNLTHLYFILDEVDGYLEESNRNE